MQAKEDTVKDLPKSPYPHWASFTLINPLRRRLIDRAKIVRDAGVTLGSKVLEIGCGPGFFTEYLAKHVGKEGKVYSQDVQPQMIEKLKRNMARFTISENIIPMLTDSAKIDLPDNSIDVVFAASVFEEIEKEGLLEKTLDEISRVCKDGGYLFYIEHILGMGLSHIEDVLKIIESKGFVKISSSRSRVNVFATFKKIG
jgi:ubiquinone/menaquinone biosynthesis C-methylase UbiE